jgi:hypothetical protein
LAEREAVEVVLDHGFDDEVKNERVTVLRIVKPRVKELRRAGEASKGKGPVEEARQLLAQCTGRDPVALDAMEIDDFQKCSDALGRLMGGGADPS